ncbi:FkbM family methyltransferase [Sediminibacterium sp.]|uniref:FkbM family methyltransferase n=1 Tax=Sediminibacterium sp. TaxID=1917865 RepID=UPI0025F02641|nr:FkbM family methyltransferase [Sediminibacterium sp.]MBW0177666.1 FkbM family methyltransferase [Sediminibacterium sp.]
MQHKQSVFVRIIRKIAGLLNVNDFFLNLIRNRKKRIVYNQIEYTFSTPNSLCLIRANTFATKEPETLKWIDGFAPGSVLWDIGANVGLYSIYAAKSKECVVYSFEPSVFNLEVLARNISLNDVGKYITVMPFALNDKMGRGDLSMSSDNWGGALSTFDKSYGMDGKEFNVVFKYPMFSMAMDDLVNKLGFTYPDYIKLDVDGIEQLILAGGTNVLSKVKGVLIELPDLWPEQTRICEDFLQKAGLKKVLKNVWHPKDNPYGSANQIWQRI